LRVNTLNQDAEIMSERAILEMKKISKHFPGVVALDNVDLDLKHGEVLGLVGQNGAGKSTLIKVLDGVYQCEQGEIFLEGEIIELKHPSDAYKIGIRVIHQELSTFDSLTVAENIFAGEMITEGMVKKINWKRMVAESNKVLEELGIDIDAKIVMGELNLSQKQLVEIAKAIRKRAKIIVMDEPTSALGERDINTLFKIVRRLQSSGISVIYISHHLDEVFEITDRVMVLRDGKNVATLTTKVATRDELITLMVGRAISEMYPKQRIKVGEPVLSVEGFSLRGAFYDISFSLRKSEILGIFGLLGCGKDEIVGSIFGLLERDSGTLRISKQEVDIRGPYDSTQNNLGLIPVDRKNDGFALTMKVKENIVMANVKGLGDGWLINRKLYQEKAKKWIGALNIKTPNMNTTTESLSGGNQQKVVLAKCLESEARIIIMNEPTRGIDVGAKVEIYKIMESICENGGSIIMLSSDLPEIMSLADRILVVSKGKISARFTHGDYTQEKLLHAANL
jgi:ABC-type sugar transport system ATPase subunit